MPLKGKDDILWAYEHEYECKKKFLIYSIHANMYIFFNTHENIFPCHQQIHVAFYGSKLQQFKWFQCV